MTLYLGNNLISGVATPIEGARNIGQIITSTIPLTDAGLHLLDGAVISGSGSYADFVTYIAGLVNTYPDLFTTEANWQTAVTTYGVCGKFVYDSVNNTVRLPKRTSEHGDLIKSYSSGTDWYRIYEDGWCEQGGQIDHYPSNRRITVNFLKPMADTNYSIQRDCISTYTSGTTDYYWHGFYSISKTGFECGVSGDANTYYKWYVCGYINVSDYQYSPIYEYIVIATSTKTQIEVDIDEIITDLNGKADVDLSNINPTQTVKNTIVGWGMPDYSARYTMTLTQTPQTVSQKSYIIAESVHSYLGSVIINDVVVASGAYYGYNSYMALQMVVDTTDNIKVDGNNLVVTIIPLKGVS